MVRDFVTHLVPSFLQKYMDSPCDLHFVTHLVSNLDPLEPLDVLVGDQMRYRVQTTGTIRVLLKS
ncbi:hypothetical protein Hanom_Chr07g00640571 [Helianthus anomalus]